MTDLLTIVHEMGSLKTDRQNEESSQRDDQEEEEEPQSRRFERTHPLSYTQSSTETEIVRYTRFYFLWYEKDTQTMEEWGTDSYCPRNGLTELFSENNYINNEAQVETKCRVSNR
jgi:hypothetical protein